MPRTIFRYPRNLFRLTDSQLAEAGEKATGRPLVRDNLGQIRDHSSPDGRTLVCAMTGATHKRRLYPHPIPDTEADKDTEPDVMFVSGLWYREVGASLARRGIRFGGHVLIDELPDWLEDAGAVAKAFFGF